MEKVPRQYYTGIRNLVVFDADSSTNGGGFGRRKLELLAKMKELNITADLFLFPNNHDGKRSIFRLDTNLNI